MHRMFRNLWRPLAAGTLALLATGALAEPAFDVLRSYYATDHLPLSVRTVNESNRAGVVRQDLEFAAFDNELVRARFERPTNVVNPPVILLLHGLTQSLDQWWRADDGPFSFPSAHRATLINAGYAVFAIDVRNHGARISDTDFRDPVIYVENGYLEAARKMIAQTAIDVRRAIDVIATLPDVDADRIGLVGYSLGAYVGYLATAVDPRIDAAVIMAMPFLPHPEGDAESFTAQSLYTEGLAGRPVHFVAATMDEFYTPEMLEELVSIIPDGATMEWIESGHDLPPGSASITRTFLKHHL